MAAELNEVLAIIPDKWHELMLSLYNGENAFTSSDLLLQDKISSSFGIKACWETLLTALVQKEPFIKEDKLVFVPFFTKLRIDVKRSFLNLLLRYRENVPLESLSRFVTSIHPHTSLCLKHLTNMLLNYIMMKREGNERKFMPVDMEYKLSNVLETQARDLCIRMKKLSQLHQPSSVMLCKPENDSISEQESTVNAVLDFNNKSPQATVSDAECSSTFNMDHDVICISDEELMSQSTHELHLSQSKKRASDVSLTQTSVKRSKLSLTADENERGENMNEEYQAVLERLREEWETDSTKFSDDLGLLVATTPDKLQSICESLNRAELSEMQISSACKHLAQLSENLSFANCRLFIQLILLPKVFNLENNISRTLIGAVLKLADVYPQQLCDGFIVPCCSSLKGPPQMELICKLIKDSYNSANREYMFEKLATELIEVNESMVTILHTLVDCKVEIATQSMNQILHLLYKNGSNMAENLKFGKLLLAIIKKYGDQLSQENIDTLSHILSGHGTFMKKSAELALRKLKVKK